MILTGKEDLRVRRTIEAIKESFEALICEKEYESIKVTELCERARINKKTFYTYYKDLDELLGEIQLQFAAEYIERVKDYSLPDELDKVNREFFLYSEEQGLAYEKITCAGSGSYHYIRSGMLREVNETGWSRSKKYNALPEFEKRILMNFVNNAVLGFYRQWVEDGRKIPLDEIIELTNRMICSGVDGYFKK
ncbi:MAG: TetR/AcrR family transcriptional regulator [Ruminiclostridium sp.]|nr:TetR/AcrR family transcriptional regulator [Ruminiclostridium sp.]